MKDILIAAESGDVRIRELIDSDLVKLSEYADNEKVSINLRDAFPKPYTLKDAENFKKMIDSQNPKTFRSEEHTSELQSRPHLVCRLLLEKKKKKKKKKHNK